MSGPGTNTGHGHVWPRPDGMVARCGGPAMCQRCAIDAARTKQVKEPDMQTNQTPEALAEEIKALHVKDLRSHGVYGREVCLAIDSLRDMAASGAKECAALQRDAERYCWLRGEVQGPHIPLAQVVWKWNGIRDSGDWTNLSGGDSLDSHVDAAIAATKRGGA